MLVVIGTSLVGGLPVGGASAEAAPPRVIVSVYPWDVPGTPYLPDPSVPRPDVLGTTVDALCRHDSILVGGSVAWVRGRGAHGIPMVG